MAEEKTTVKDVEIIRQGSQIIIPPKMTYDEVIEWCKRKRDEDEREVNVTNELPYSPLDGAVNFHRALADIYGWTELVPMPGFFGPTPPTMVRIPISATETLQVPWGRVKVPGIEGHLDTGMLVEPTPRFCINGKVKQKHVPEVKAIVDRTLHLLETRSIYKNQAVKVSFDYIREGKNFSPTEHCPKFMKLTGVAEDDLILSDDVMGALNIGLFWPIEYSDACRTALVPLKRSVLLYGPYGTGKTLTANVTALKSTNNKWTFIYLDNVQDLKKGLQFAVQYAPAVLFSEDIDRATSGERTVSMDALLNTLDGVDTKGKEIITVFTTNHIENINPSVLRMGRVDTAVFVQEPDAKAAQLLVKKYGRGLLNTTTNFDAIGKKLSGRIPAFIREVTERAKIAAIARLKGNDITGKVLEADIMAAAVAMEPHADFLKGRGDDKKGGPEIFIKLPESKIPEARELLQTLGLHVGAGVNGDE